MNLIEIFFDTSSIRPSLKNYTEFHLNSNYQDFVDFIGTKDLTEKININICRIVFMEIEKQIRDEFEKKVDVLKCFPSITVEHYKTENDYINNLKNIMMDYAANNDINVIDIPINEKSYLNIINRAVNKKKPFVGGEKGDSDKGFKDAIQWETILDYAKNNNSRYFLLITGNKCDFVQTLEKEFNKLTGKNIRIFTTIGDAQEYVLRLNDMPSRYTYVKKSLNGMFKEEKLLSFIEDKCSEREYEIDYIESIDNIVDLGNDLYEFDLYVDENHQCFYKVECQLINENELINTDIIICL